MSDAIELATRSTDATNESRPRYEASDPQDGDAFIAALPPVDRGHAWVFLAAATTVETLVWGFPFSIGILHAYWSSTLFPGHESALTLAATLQTGLMYLTPAILGPLFTAYPRWMKPVQFFGLSVSAASLIGAAFATEAWHLVVSIGCFYPFAGALYLPCATLLFEWFQARRGLATGIMFAGTGVGGTVFPFIVSALLTRFGYKATMISFALAFWALNALALLAVKRRVPVGPQAGRMQAPIDWSFLKRSTLAVGVVIVLATSLGNFVPSLWIPSWAEEVNATKPDGTALISLMNAASVPGNALMGFLSDRAPMRVTIAASCVLASIACLVLWGLGTHDSILVAFALVWGATGLSFVGLWSKMISIICQNDPTASTLVFSIFACLKGVGNMTSGPISTALLQVNALNGAAGAYGLHNYGLLLVYTGVVMSVAGFAGFLFKDK